MYLVLLVNSDMSETINSLVSACPLSSQGRLVRIATKKESSSHTMLSRPHDHKLRIF